MILAAITGTTKRGLANNLFEEQIFQEQSVRNNDRKKEECESVQFLFKESVLFSVLKKFPRNELKMFCIISLSLRYCSPTLFSEILTFPQALPHNKQDFFQKNYSTTSPS